MCASERSSRTLRDFQRKWQATLEAALFAPFVDEAPLLEHNKHCFLCHVQGAGEGGLPVVVDPAVPERWLRRGGFSHRKHGLMPCDTCHAGSADSVLTSDVTLPRLEMCLQCHAAAGPQSVATDCADCHTYHALAPGTDARQPPPAKSLDELLGRDG